MLLYRQYFQIIRPVVKDFCRRCILVQEHGSIAIARKIGPGEEKTIFEVVSIDYGGSIQEIVLRRVRPGPLAWPSLPLSHFRPLHIHAPFIGAAACDFI